MARWPVPFNIAFLYRKGRLPRLPSALAGEAPTEFFYSAIELARKGCEVEDFEFDPAQPGGAAAGALDLFRGIAVHQFDVDTDFWNPGPTASHRRHCRGMPAGGERRLIASLRADRRTTIPRF